MAEVPQFRNQLPARYAKRTKRPRPLTVKLTLHYFRRSESRGHVFESGERPQGLPVGVPSQRAWKAFLRSTDARNAIRVARRFDDWLQSVGDRSYAKVAEHFGVSRPMVCYHIALVRRLPQDFVEWLEANQDPAVLAYFTERRLRPVAKLSDGEAQVTALGDMIRELQQSSAGTKIPGFVSR